MRILAIVGCGIAALLIVAAVALWVIDAPKAYFNNRFCAEGIEAVYTIWDKRYLNSPLDERCEPIVGPRTVAAGMALGGVAGLLVLGIPLLLTRRRPAA